MHLVESELLLALTELDTAVRGMKASPQKPDLARMFERIDGLGRQLRPDADPRLLHYVHKRSYEKARLWLLDREGENARGNCDGATGAGS
jgi:hypothetical protein